MHGSLTPAPRRDNSRSRPGCTGARVASRRGDGAILARRAVRAASDIDVRVLPFARVDELVDGLEKWARVPWDVMHAARFELDERVLLHRLSHARTVWSKSRADVPRPSNEGLRLKLHVARQMAPDRASRPSRTLGDRRLRVARFAAQDLLGHSVGALLAANGFSNPLPKWRSRLLSLLPADWEASAVLRPSGLVCFGASLEPPSRAAYSCAPDSLEHAPRIGTLARAVFSSCRKTRSQWGA
jgi:hypothetical protein